MARHLLEVVEDHQAGTACGDGVAELHDGIVPAQRQVEPLRHGAGDAVDAARAGQIAEPHAARKLAEPAAAVARRQAGLAAAADAEHRHQARAGLDAARQLGQRIDTADEGVAFGGQAVPDVARRQPQLALTHDAVGLVGVGRRQEGRIVVADLEQFDRLVQALQAPVPVRLQPKLLDDAQRLPGIGRQEDLSAQGRRHDARGGRLGHTLDLDRLGAERDVGGAVLAQRDRADVQSGARLERRNEPLQCPLIGQCIAHRVRSRVEQQQHAIGLVDLAPMPDRQQIARRAVMRRPQPGHLRIADAQRQPGAVDDIGEQQGAQGAHRTRSARR